MIRFKATARNYIIGYLGCFLFLLPATLMAECQISLQWNPNSPNPNGYRLFQRESGSSYNYHQYYDVSQGSACTVGGLENNTTYHFVVRAYVGGEESTNSNEASYYCGNGPASTSSTPPAKPYGINPSDNSQDVSTRPTLTTSAFYDPDQGDYHSQTRWQIYSMDDDTCVYDIISSSSLTNLTVPTSTLSPFTTYYWTAQYYDQNGNMSAAAQATDFTTQQSDDSTATLAGSGGGGSSGGGGGFGCFIRSLFSIQ